MHEVTAGKAQPIATEDPVAKGHSIPRLDRTELLHVWYQHGAPGSAILANPYALHIKAVRDLLSGSTTQTSISQSRAAWFVHDPGGALHVVPHVTQIHLGDLRASVS